MSSTTGFLLRPDSELAQRLRVMLAIYPSIAKTGPAWRYAQAYVRLWANLKPSAKREKSWWRRLRRKGPYAERAGALVEVMVWQANRAEEPELPADYAAVLSGLLLELPSMSFEEDENTWMGQLLSECAGAAALAPFVDAYWETLARADALPANEGLWMVRRISRAMGANAALAGAMWQCALRLGGDELAWFQALVGRLEGEQRSVLIAPLEQRLAGEDWGEKAATIHQFCCDGDAKTRAAGLSILAFHAEKLDLSWLLLLVRRVLEPERRMRDAALPLFHHLKIRAEPEVCDFFTSWRDAFVMPEAEIGWEKLEASVFVKPWPALLREEFGVACVTWGWRSLLRLGYRLPVSLQGVAAVFASGKVGKRPV